MKKLTILATALFAIMMTLNGCMGKTQPVPFDNGDSLDAEALKDPTVYGICGQETAMNTLQLINDLGDTIVFDISEANETGKVLGGLQAGERLVVVPGSQEGVAAMVINQGALLGDWVMPNPLDGSSEMGFSIKEGGIAEGIEQSSLSYKTWKLVKGQLEFYCIREGGGDQEEYNMYDIISLGPDSLVLKDADDTYRYGRLQEHKLDSDIKLEDVSEDDYRI